MRTKIQTIIATHKNKNCPPFNTLRVGSCFSDAEVKNLAKSMRAHYSSCLWQKGDILLVDNKLVAHAGMPGSGPRLIRAMICNPLAMKYSFGKPGYLKCKNRSTEAIGSYMLSGRLDVKVKEEA